MRDVAFTGVGNVVGEEGGRLVCTIVSFSTTGNSDISWLNDNRNKMANGMKVGSVIYPMAPKQEVKRQNDAGRHGQMRMGIYIRALGHSCCS